MTPKEAGLKAFIVTKIGDLFFMLGLALLYAEVGSLAYREVFNPETLEHLAGTPFLGTSMATVIAFLLFGGTVGKSAQFPLHVWLPDAMEGPTPVSALIHAATMVSAGVFLIVRAFPILQAANESVLAIGGIPFVAFIGAFTAMFSSIQAIAQDDIKGVLAFSTISQLGYMVAALGIGAYVAGAFHLITHAFFKALLFLGSGSVIHGVEHGHHAIHEHAHGDHQPHGGAEKHDRHEEREGHAHAEPVGWFNPNDMKNMGGLARRMPRTFWTFLLGGLALSGFPLITAGFWSKDQILAQAYEQSPAVFWILAVAAGITAFYTMRQICLTFFGEPRTEAAAHASESAGSMTAPLIILAVFAVGLGWAGIPEHFPIIGGLVPNWVHDFVGSAIEAGHAGHAARVTRHLAEGSHGFVWQPLVMSVVLALGGLALGWLVYGRRPLKAGQIDPVEAGMRRASLGWLYEAMRNRFYFDELYQAAVVHPSIWLASAFDAFDYGREEGKHGVVDGLVSLIGRTGRAVADVAGWLDANVVDSLVNLAGDAGMLLSTGFGVLDVSVVDGLVNLAGRAGVLLSTASDLFDLGVVDGAVNGVGSVVRGGGKAVQPIQTGRVQNYLLLATLAVLALIASFFAILFLQI
ncbi:MAG: proton-conducting transporter membrane subunit [Anaerolineae bacterium]